MRFHYDENVRAAKKNAHEIRFHYDENIRAAEKHRMELKSISLKNELLQLELEEKRLRIAKLHC